MNIVTLDSMIQIMLSLTSTIQTPILRSIVGPNSDYSLIQRLEKNYLNVSCYVLTVIDLSICLVLISFLVALYLINGKANVMPNKTTIVATQITKV